MDQIANARRWYAEDLRCKTPVLRNPHIIEAFGAVPREAFVGPGPWSIIPYPYREPFITPDDDPRWLYHDVLVSIDPSRKLNNGMPSFWARNFEQLDIGRGERVLQIGAGSGYYSAVLAEIVGPSGRVTAIEVDPVLAARAETNLQGLPQVQVISGDGRNVDTDASQYDLVIVFAGCTHPAPQWLDGLADNGRLLLPLTSEDWSGFLLRVVRRGASFEASSIGGVSIYPCTNGRDEDGSRRLKGAPANSPMMNVPIQALHRGIPLSGESERVWYQASGFWLERQGSEVDATTHQPEDGNNNTA
ncbi:methyltransferase domain-containing protein [Bradyrhizobium sp. 83002]|uniref:protein-L-isoaspartate O-methyltransferase family protein n=1 Tax=Bradyrhizobium aeschynomenes TaxID=2734909 RepID=UPI00155353F3|nr:methyltransferase domain-containing protein [Bradyrhizobium aeschynomenes]NPU13057.1 methyltransferase domain-containing protein [Bradyrhizobium aeschynomenes]